MNMRNFKLFSGVLAATLATPAMAGDGVYVGIDAGGISVNDAELGIGVLDDAGTLKSGKGYDVGIVAGYDFGKFRLEAEASSRTADSSGIEVRKGGVPITSAATTAGTGQISTNGQATAKSLMANAMLDLGGDDGLQAFVGGGAGIAKVSVENFIVDPVWLKGSDSGFAWQALAGIRYPVNDHVDVGLKYRFFNGPKAALADRLGRDAIVDNFQSHSLMANISYNFGGGRK
jgi:OmpA-OmpF porin, OOP family